jgi:CRP/FNR family transcriptional regulator
MVDAELLARIPALAGASRTALDALAAGAAVRRFEADETIFRAGTPTRGLFIVIEGSVRVVRTRSGRRHVVHSETIGGTLGEVPLFDGGVYPATAVAAEPTRCVVVPRDALMRAIAGCPDVALLFLHRLASRVRTLVDRLDERSARTVTARLAEYLLSRPVSARGTISLGMTQAKLAEELGTVREVVVRSLRLLTAQGAIEAVGGGRWRVVDGVRLNAVR